MTYDKDLLRGAQAIADFTGIPAAMVYKIAPFDDNPIQKKKGLGLCLSKIAWWASLGVPTDAIPTGDQNNIKNPDI